MEIKELLMNIEKMIYETYMKENIKVELRIDNQFKTYHVHDVLYATEFRIAFLGDTIIVSRVNFKVKRKGIMTYCYKLLKKFAKANNFKRVIIQSVLTSEMSAWCIKNKFKPNEYCMKIDGVLVGDYVKEV